MNNGNGNNQWNNGNGNNQRNNGNSNSNNQRGNGNSNNQRGNGNNYWRHRNHRHNHRVPWRTYGAPMRPQCDGMRNHHEPVDSNASTTLVNSIKQGILGVNKQVTMGPIDIPVNGSPGYRRYNFGRRNTYADNARSTDMGWQFLDTPPYPKCIPILNGSPYTGGPTTASPSPVGSSRGSPYSNSSPLQDISRESSPMMSNFSPIDSNGGRRSSAEEMQYKMSDYRQDNGRASSSQSPEDLGYNLKSFRGNIANPWSDDVHFSYYPSCSSTASRSSDDLSLDNILGEFRDSSPDSGVTYAKRNSTSSGGSNRCNECTIDRFCDNCLFHNNLLGNVVDAGELNQHNQIVQEITSALTGLHINKLDMLMSGFPIQPASHMPLANPELDVATQMSYPAQEQLAIADQPQNATTSTLVVFQAHTLNGVCYCTMYNGTQSFYCQTCSKSFCVNCGSLNHLFHTVTHLFVAKELADTQAKRVVKECLYGMAVIREDLDNQKGHTAKLEINSQEAAANVRDFTRQLIEAIQKREKEMLEAIETSRQTKLAAIQKREEKLRTGLTYLNMTLESINKSIEVSTRTISPVNLFISKDMAYAQIFNVTSMRYNLPTQENGFMVFSPEKSILPSIRIFGELLTSNGNVGHVGERRFITRPNIPSMTLPTMYPCGRAIPGMNYVSITNGRFLPNANPFMNIGYAYKSIGNNGKPEDRLCRPWGVACDREGHIVVVDRSCNRIQIYDNNGAFVRRFGCYGKDHGQFNRPAGVAVDARQRIIVADKDNHRIQVFTMKGHFLMSFGEKGSYPGLFNYPWDVATNDACEIVISDTRNHRLQLFSAEGIFLRKFGFETQPQLWKSFDSPRGVAFTREGNVLVSDFNNHRMVVVQADFLSAKYLGRDSLSPHQAPPKTFLRPQGISIDDNGNIIVCDSRNHRVQILNADGECIWKFGRLGTGEGDNMDRPSGIAITPDGKIVIVDFGNNRVLVF